jgi:diguanylate cyclase
LPVASPSVIASLIVAVSTIFAVITSNTVIYVADLLLPDFTSRFDNYAFATVIPLAVAPILIVPLAYTISRLMKLNEEVRRTARTDALTGLLNRHGFFERAERIFAAPEELVAVMMVDVDRFKEVNDTYGHGIGDDYLRHIARGIVDAVGAGASQYVVARIGGDEFAVLLVGGEALAGAATADRICCAVRRGFDAHAGLVATVSVGVAMRSPGRPLDEAMRAADDAAYRAKRAGRDRWILAAPENCAPAREPGVRAA